MPVLSRRLAALAGAALALLSWAAAPRAEAQRGYVVRAGDTLVEIARRHHVTVEALQRANRLRGTNVREGARLQIPGGETWRRSSGRLHHVRPGDTLARIARRYRVSIEDLQAANGLRGELLRTNQTLNVPRHGQSGAALHAELRQGNPAVVPDAPPELAAEESEATEERARRLHLGSLPVAQRVLREAPPAEWALEVGPPESVEGTLLLPVAEGRYLRGWGSGPDGYHLAIDIGAPQGTEIRAAERGLVVYVGSGIRGYGNLVVLVHATGWVTAYAHNQRNEVVAGQIVARGARLGTVGQTGFARGPHVHFIFAFEGRHCDATPLFTPRIARASGEEIDAPVAVWDAERRPSAVQCLERSARPHPHYDSRGRSRRGRRR